VGGRWERRTTKCWDASLSVDTLSGRQNAWNKVGDAREWGARAM
jgi:hypothetical protein